jgi:hypothetical protein
MMQQQGQSPILVEMEAQNIEEERRAGERRALEREALAPPSAPAERRPHILDPIQRLLRAMRRDDR